MSIFFGTSPPITMKRTETYRTGFCLLGNIRNRRRSFFVLGTPAAVFANRSSKTRNERGPRGAPLSHRFLCAFGMDGLTGRFVRAAMLPRCPIGRYIHIICIQIQIYCITFMVAYSTHYALIRMKRKYFRCIQPNSRIYLQYLNIYTNFCEFAIDFRREKIYNPFIRSAQTAQARRRRTPWALPRYF